MSKQILSINICEPIPIYYCINLQEKVSIILYNLFTFLKITSKVFFMCYSLDIYLYVEIINSYKI